MRKRGQRSMQLASMITLRRKADLALCLLASLFLFLLPLLPLPSVHAERVTIKINNPPGTSSGNTNTHTNTNSNNANTAGGTARHGAGRYSGSQPVLYREPNAITPPPFLLIDAALSAADATASSLADTHVFASYYGENEGSGDAMASNQEAGFVAGTVPGGSEGIASDVSDLSSDQSSSSPEVASSSSASASNHHIVVDEATLTPYEESWMTEEVAQWLQLDGECYTHTTASYVYSFCPFRNITQKSTSTTLHVVLGVFDRWIEKTEPVTTPSDQNNPAEAASPTNGADPVADASPSSSSSSPSPSPSTSTLEMAFTDGTSCANGKRRSTLVRFICDPRDSRISTVTEPHVCEYTMNFFSPLMCDKNAAPEQSSTGAASPAYRIIEAMQTCINTLYHNTVVSPSTASGKSSTSLTTGDRARIQEEIKTECHAFLPKIAHSFAEEEAKPNSAATSTKPTPPPLPDKSKQQQKKKRYKRNSLPPKTDAAPPPEAAATVSSTTNEAIVGSSDIAPSSSSTIPDTLVDANSAAASSPNADEFSSSPYSQLDDTTQQ